MNTAITVAFVIKPENETDIAGPVNHTENVATRKDCRNRFQQVFFFALGRILSVPPQQSIKFQNME